MLGVGAYLTSLTSQGDGARQSRNQSSRSKNDIITYNL